MEPENKKSDLESEEKKVDKVDRLKKNLYTQQWKKGKKQVAGLHKKYFDIKDNWQDEDSLTQQLTTAMKKPEKRKTFLWKMLIASVGFFVFALIIVSLTILGGMSNVSTANVDISVIGPASVDSGDTLDLQITITNNNAIALELADLIVEYPSGTKSVENLETELKSIRETLDNIPAGKSITKKLSAVVYGEENSEKDVIISLEYRIAGSNAIFFKDRSYDLVISSSPVNLVISPIKESISGQEIEFSVSVVSNADDPITDLVLEGDYPFGFEFVESDPRPKFSDNVWIIDEGDVVKIKGIMKGQEGEDKVFKFKSGTVSTVDERKVGAVFALAEKTFAIQKPFIGMDVVINGKSAEEYVFDGAETIRVDIIWQNNTQNNIVDVEVEGGLAGEVINRNNISVDGGFYRSNDDVIFWDKRTNGELSELYPGDSGQLSFSFTAEEFSKRSNFTNPEIDLSINVKGNRVGSAEGDVPEQITSTVTKNIKIQSDLLITPRATYYTGPFTNTGSLPPKVDQETTYTITWFVVNTTSNVTDTRVVATLPSYVRWMGVVTPSSESISYNPVGGEIVWNIGEVKAGTGVRTSPKEISFQVALMPSLSQVGSPPVLVNEITVSGTDRFANVVVSGQGEEVSTRLHTDPGFSYEKGLVIE